MLSRYCDEQPLQLARFEILKQRVHARRLAEGGLDMFDQRILMERLDYLNQRLRSLKRRARVKKEEFIADEDKVEAALYGLQTSIEAITDIGNHLIAALSLRRPESRADIPLVLRDADVLDKELAQRLHEAVNFRNLIVHAYLGVNPEQVYEILQKDLGDIEAFVTAITLYVEATGN